MYTDAFEKAINHAMLYEVGKFWKLTDDVRAGKIGTRELNRAVGYVNDPLDLGGETKFGVAKNANPTVDIAKLTWEQAKAIYYKEYWIKGNCDKMPSRLAILHFDGCVNHGVGRANRFLQNAIGLIADGAIGPKTLATISAQCADPKVGEKAICNEICNLREKFYNGIVEKKPEQRRFLKGWLLRISEMRDYVTAL